MADSSRIFVSSNGDAGLWLHVLTAGWVSAPKMHPPVRTKSERNEMSDYLLIESRDPFDSGDTSKFCDLAASLVGNGDKVTVFLVQNGVLPARQSSMSDMLSRLADSGVEVLADEFSLSERGIGGNKLARGVRSAPIEVIVDQLAEGRKAIWH
jgi:intracellular sulfur oxidation DsrE/DsrF family protein